VLDGILNLVNGSSLEANGDFTMGNESVLSLDAGDTSQSTITIHGCATFGGYLLLSVVVTVILSTLSSLLHC